MKNIGPRSVLTMAVALVFAQSTPSFGDVIVNNVLSPFTVLQVGPGYGSGYYGGPRYYSPDYYDGPRYSGYYSRPSYSRSGYYDRGHGFRHGYCWVTTDRDRGFGFSGRCR